MLSAQLPISARPTGLDECFFNSLVVRLPLSLIFCQFWLFFVFKFIVVFLLVVREGTVYLPKPPSWPELRKVYFNIYVEFNHASQSHIQTQTTSDLSKRWTNGKDVIKNKSYRY